MSDPADVLAGETAARDTVMAVRASLCSGTELHASLCRLLGYGHADSRLIGWCRALQKMLERNQ